jgi:acyl carrier protein
MGGERLVYALSEIWTDLVKRRNGHISYSDVGFIAKKLESFAQTQKGHLHRAFSVQQMGAVVNVLTQEAEIQLSGAVAGARRDLAIMAREHEVFSSARNADRQKTSGGNLATQDTQSQYIAAPPDAQDQGRSGESEDERVSGNVDAPAQTIWAQVWSWGVVSVVAPFALAAGIAFMTSGHLWATDGCYAVGVALFLIKFCTWEETKQQPPARKWTLQIGVTLLSLIAAALALLWNHSINGAASKNFSPAPKIETTQVTAGSTTHTEANHMAPAPKSDKGTGRPESPIDAGTISVADRVKIIIGHQLQVDAAKLRLGDDFEANLGADPADIYFLMDSLGQEYNITIPSSDSTNLHTVGETIAYIEQKLRQKREQESKKADEQKQKAQSRSEVKVSVAERVTVLIAHNMAVDAAKIKPSDDFEVDLGGNPSGVYFLMRDLEQEYGIKIPAEDSRNLHTVGETIAYIQMREKSQ